MVDRENSRNAASDAFMVDVDASQSNEKTEPKRSRTGGEKISSIVERIINVPTLEKEREKEYPWKEVALELARRLRNGKEKEAKRDPNASIAKDVQELKVSVQLLSSQLRTQGTARRAPGIQSWADVARGEGGVTGEEQRRSRGESSESRRQREVVIKIENRKEVDEVKNKTPEQILRGIADISVEDRGRIASLRQLPSGDIALHAVSSEARVALEKSSAWAQGIVGSAVVSRKKYPVLVHGVRTSLDANSPGTKNRLENENGKLHPGLEVLRVAWPKKVAGSGKTHSSLIVEVATAAMANRLIDMGMVESYQACSCELFERGCRATQCFKCYEFGHMAMSCKKDERCSKCGGRHLTAKCAAPADRKRCVNCNGNHESWMRSCPKWVHEARQAKIAFQNRPTRYPEALRRRDPSTSSSTLVNVSAAVSSQDASESTWQMVGAKKRRVLPAGRFREASSERSPERTQEQGQGKKRGRPSAAESMQHAAAIPGQKRIAL